MTEHRLAPGNSSTHKEAEPLADEALVAVLGGWGPVREAFRWVALRLGRLVEEPALGRPAFDFDGYQSAYYSRRKAMKERGREMRARSDDAAMRASDDFAPSWYRAKPPQ
jgi:hypothetical protein